MEEEQFFIENEIIRKENELKNQIFSYKGVSLSMVWDCTETTHQGFFISKYEDVKWQKYQIRQDFKDSFSQPEEKDKETGSQKIYLKLLKEQRQLKLFEITDIQKEILYLKQ